MQPRSRNSRSRAPRPARRRPRDRAPLQPGLHLFRDVRNLLTCAEAITRAALERRETRGAHSRLDFAEPRDDLGELNIVLSRDGDEMRVERRPVVKVEALEPLVDARRRQDRR